MEEIIPIHNQGPELRADSRDIARLFGIEHDSLRDLCETYREELEQFGIYRFETEKLPI